MTSPSIIGGDDRKRLLAEAGVTPDLLIVRVDGQSSQDSQQLDNVDLPRGFYRIVQRIRVYNAQGELETRELDAAPTVPTSPSKWGPPEFPVKMEEVQQLPTPPSNRGPPEFPVKTQEAQQLIDQVWYINPEYGVAKGYSIVPAVTPGVDSPLGGTAYHSRIGDNLVVIRSPCYPIWVVSCDEIIKYRTRVKESQGLTPPTSGTDVQVQSNYFRIYEVGTLNCWITNYDLYVKVKQTSRDQSELYEISPYSPSIIVVNSVDPISFDWDDDQVQRHCQRRRLWFHSSTITKETFPAYISVQLTTDSRDQGWANYPDAGLGSWFEIALLKGPTTPETFDLSKIKTAEDGTLLTFVSHRLAVDADYKEQTGKEFGRAEELWKNFEEGNVFGVLACAQFRAWKCEARSGKLDFKVVLPTPQRKDDV